MQKIILASASPQRKKLLKLFNMPFKVHKSGVDELATIQSNVIHLVKHNALIKAQDVAQHYKDALVIGCDTVVYSKSSGLILKPNDLAHAKRQLKKLMKTPHWVYSGLVVIDTAKNKTLTSYDKTKVFMNTLSNKEMDAYYKEMNPMDKAGGFDIEGLGASFIPRIEGCYFNVVGLPLAQLHTMLKQCGLSIFSS